MWPLHTRLDFCRLICKEKVDPESLMRLLGLPTNKLSFESLSLDEQGLVLYRIFEAAQSDNESGAWIDLAQKMTSGGDMEVAAMHHWLKSLFGSSLRQDLEAWLKAVQRRGIDLEDYGELAKARWPETNQLTFGSSSETLGYEPGRQDRIELCISSVNSGPHIRHWSLQITMRRDIAVHELHRQPGSWPESTRLPTVIWGWPAPHEESQGTWVERDIRHVSSEVQVRMDGDAVEPLIDVYARRCASTQDDNSPALPAARLLSRDRNRSLTVTPSTTGPQRSRSQPAALRYYDRLQSVEHRFIGLVSGRDRHWLTGWTYRIRDVDMVQIHDDSTIPSSLLGVRISWQRNLNRLFIPTHGLRRAENPRDRRVHFTL